MKLFRFAIRGGLVCFLLVGSYSCSRNFESNPSDDPAPPPTATEKDSSPGGVEPSAAASVTLGAVSFQPQAGWIPVQPTGSMRKAQYSLLRAEGDPEDAEMIVFFFPGGGGGVEANIDRWIGQFSRSDGASGTPPAETSYVESNGTRKTVLDVRGTYNRSSGPMMAEKSVLPGFRMLGVVAETSEGPWFFKLTGPEATIARWEASFNEFVKSIGPS